MQEETGKETLATKNAFEHACASRAIVPKHYHVDNGRYAENNFVQDCRIFTTHSMYLRF